jgi:hypothetical protein
MMDIDEIKIDAHGAFVHSQNVATSVYLQLVMLPSDRIQYELVPNIIRNIQAKMNRYCSDDTFDVQADLLNLWQIYRHYPLAQPSSKRKPALPRNPLEFVDFMKAIQYHIRVGCDYYTNDAERAQLPTWDPDFMLLRERAYTVINMFKQQLDNKNDMKKYPLLEAAGRVQYTGLEAALGDEAGRMRLDTPWIKSGGSCRRNLDTKKKYTVYDKLATEWFAGKSLVSYVPQCSISGSTNAVVTTFLWTTDYAQLSVQTMATLLLSVVVILVQDGGHTIQECISAMGILFCLYHDMLALRPDHNCTPAFRMNVEVGLEIISRIHFFPIEMPKNDRMMITQEFANKMGKNRIATAAALLSLRGDDLKKKFTIKDSQEYIANSLLGCRWANGELIPFEDSTAIMAYLYNLC